MSDRKIDCRVIDSKDKDDKNTNIYLDHMTLVITVGGDGTLLSASHCVDRHTPIFGINSNPEKSVGFFCGANKDTFIQVLDDFFQFRCGGIELARMKVTKNGVLSTTRILNEALFCHQCPANTSRYTLLLEDLPLIQNNYYQKSSGFWVGPAAGSTGARQSAGYIPYPINSKELQFCVRELCAVSKEQKPTIQTFKVPFGQEFSVVSDMDNARLYIDGGYHSINVDLCDKLTFSLSNDPLFLIGKRGPHGKGEEEKKT